MRKLVISVEIESTETVKEILNVSRIALMNLIPLVAFGTPSNFATVRIQEMNQLRYRFNSNTEQLEEL